jgi:hypothetical protein
MCPSIRYWFYDLNSYGFLPGAPEPAAPPRLGGTVGAVVFGTSKFGLGLLVVSPQPGIAENAQQLIKSTISFFMMSQVGLSVKQGT